jgi:hypothetical protein
MASGALKELPVPSAWWKNIGGNKEKDIAVIN